MDRPSDNLQQSARTARRSALASAFAEAGAGLVVIASGVPVPVEGTDAFYPHRTHDAFRHAVGVSAPGCVVTCDPASGAWSLFVPAPDPADAVWHGPRDTLEVWATRTGIEHVHPRSELGVHLANREGVALLGHRDLLEQPGAYEVHPDRLQTVVWDGALTEACAQRHVERRRVKDEEEVRWMRAAADAAIAGHEVGMCAVQPGHTERELAIRIEAAMQQAGADAIAYQSIVLFGRRAAILHGHPSAVECTGDEVVLVDAGAEVAGYDSDITRTYPTGARFGTHARQIYEIVLRAQEEAIAACKPGVEYLDLHRQSMHTIAQGLVELGLLRGAPEDLIERDVVARFFPHGLGHLLGLSTHDVGGFLAGREPIDRPGLRHLRTHLPLQAGYVVTIEPGIYFNDQLLTDPVVRQSLATDVDWARVDEYMHVGGVRIEDDVLITDDGPDVLTAALPKSVAAIEALREPAAEG